MSGGAYFRPDAEIYFAVHPQGHHLFVERVGCDRWCLTWAQARQLCDLLTAAVAALPTKGGEAMSAPLPQRLRDAADAIEEINARDGLPLDTPINPHWLRTEADGMEATPA